jgi:hypothetical protein
VDYFLLRRLGAGHRSWLTAIGWIGLAAGAAYVTPLLLRSGPTSIGRVRVIDHLAVAPGTAGEAHQSGVTGVFASRSERITLDGVDQSSWWRGVAASGVFSGDTARTSIGTIRTVQDMGEGGRGNPLEALDINLWTFRAFHDHARPRLGVAASVERTGDGWAVEVMGLPEGVVIRRGAVRVGDRWWCAPEEPARRPGAMFTPGARPTVEELPPLGPAEGGRFSLRVRDGAGAPRPSVAWLRVGYPFAWAGPWGMEAPDRGVVLWDRPGIGASLPGGLGRSLAIDRRLASGRWACVLLEVEGWPMDIPAPRGSNVAGMVVLRVLVPLREADRQAPVAVGAVPREPHPWEFEHIVAPPAAPAPGGNP